MDRTAKIFIGVFFGSIALFVFYLLYDRLIQYFRKHRHDNADRRNMQNYVALNTKAMRKDEVERLVYEEYDSEDHECVVVVKVTENKTVGICAYLKDLEVEYFVEELPECCARHPADSAFRCDMAAISHWGPKWMYADAVNFLSQSGELVKAVNTPKTREQRRIRQFEERFEYKMFFQWLDNFRCDSVANEEMWEELVLMADALLQNEDADWSDFPLEHWVRKRVHLKNENFHNVEHPGDITPERQHTTDENAEQLVLVNLS